MEKRLMNLKEASKYVGFSESHMYRLTSTGVIPFSKPTGGTLFFDKDKLDEWLLSNASKSNHEKEILAATHITTSKLRSSPASKRKAHAGL